MNEKRRNIQNKTEKANPELKIIWLTFAKVNKSFYSNLIETKQQNITKYDSNLNICIRKMTLLKILSLLETKRWKSMLILGHDAKF